MLNVEQISESENDMRIKSNTLLVNPHCQFGVKFIFGRVVFQNNAHKNKSFAVRDNDGKKFCVLNKPLCWNF